MKKRGLLTLFDSHAASTSAHPLRVSGETREHSLSIPLFHSLSVSSSKHDEAGSGKQCALRQAPPTLGEGDVCVYRRERLQAKERRCDCASGRSLSRFA